MSNSNSNTSSGIGVIGLLGVAFVVLKLTHFIDWSWWWVTLPFWGGLAFVLALLLIAAIVYLIRNKIRRNKWRKKLKR